MKGSKAKYTVMIPQSTGLADYAHQRCMQGPVRLDHSYLDRGKWAHWPGGGPEMHDLLVLHGDDSPEMDSHVKQLAREVGRHGQLPAVFATKEGSKGLMSWVVDNPELGRQAVAMRGGVVCEGCGNWKRLDEVEAQRTPEGEIKTLCQDCLRSGPPQEPWKPEGWDQEAFGPHGRCPMCKDPGLLEMDGHLICPSCRWAGEVFHDPPE